MIRAAERAVADPPAAGRGLLARLRHAVRRHGLSGTARLAARRLAAPLFETGGLVVFVRDLDEPLPDPGAGDPVYRAREATAAELAALRRGCAPSRSNDTLRERFRRGDLCFVVEGPDGIGHTRWVTGEPPYVPEVRRNLVLAPGDAYFYDGFTRPDARRLGLDGVARRAIFRALRDQGFRRALSYVRTDNPAGLRAASRWQRRAGTIRYLRLGRRTTRLFGLASIAPLSFSREPVAEADEEELASRSRSWGEWFRGWLGEPLAKRSTGFSALPDEYFDASARFVADALDLDAAIDTVLDVGCSSGGLSARVAPRCRSLIGVDATIGLLTDADGLGVAASDGRRLPFADGAFTKVYCTGTIHTLPSQEDGVRVIRELVRVCAPGGRVLVGAVPDRGRRWHARREAWRRGNARDRLELAASILLPASLKVALRHLAGRAPGHRLVYLEYDLRGLRGRLGELALDARPLPFPGDFWSRDFRITRSNLVIDVPVDRAPAPAP